MHHTGTYPNAEETLLFKGGLAWLVMPSSCKSNTKKGNYLLSTDNAVRSMEHVNELGKSHGYM